MIFKPPVLRLRRSDLGSRLTFLKATYKVMLVIFSMTKTRKFRLVRLTY